MPPKVLLKFSKASLWPVVLNISDGSGSRLALLSPYGLELNGVILANLIKPLCSLKFLWLKVQISLPWMKMLFIGTLTCLSEKSMHVYLGICLWSNIQLFCMSMQKETIHICPCICEYTSQHESYPILDVFVCQRMYPGLRGSPCHAFWNLPLGCSTEQLLSPQRLSRSSSALIPLKTFLSVSVSFSFPSS